MTVSGSYLLQAYGGAALAVCVSHRYASASLCALMTTALVATRSPHLVCAPGADHVSHTQDHRLITGSSRGRHVRRRRGHLGLIGQVGPTNRSRASLGGVLSTAQHTNESWHTTVISTTTYRPAHLSTLHPAPRGQRSWNNSPITLTLVEPHRTVRKPQMAIFMYECVQHAIHKQLWTCLLPVAPGLWKCVSTVTVSITTSTKGILC